MWRNLAKVQSTIQTIGNVVAPALSSDDEEEEDGLYEEGYEGEDNEEAVEFSHGGTEPPPPISARPLLNFDLAGAHDSLPQQDASLPLRNLSDVFAGVGDRTEDDDEDDGSHAAARHRGFGLVGLLAKALDGAGADESSDESHVGADHGDVDDVATLRGYQKEEQHANSPPHAPFPTHESVTRTTIPSPRLEPEMQHLEVGGPIVFTGATSDAGRFTPDAMAPAEQLASTSEDNPMGLANLNQLPEPRLFGLVRERGSVSPFSSPSTIRSTPIRGHSSGAAMNASTAGLGTASGLPPTREDDETDEATNELLKGATNGSWIGDRSGSASSEGGVRDDDGTKARADGNSQLTIDTKYIRPPPLDSENPGDWSSEPLTVNPHSSGDEDSSKLTSQTPLAAGPMSAESSTETLRQRTESARSARQQNNDHHQQAPVVSNDSHNHSPTKARGRRPSPTHESKLKPQTEAPEPPAMPYPPNASSTYSSNADHGRAAASAKADDAERQQQRLLEVRCRELEDKLRQAEAKIQVLEHAATLNKVTHASDERNQLDRLRLEFQEKEARIMAAAAEDHEQELRFLKSDMEVKVQSLQQEMARERDVFEREREYFEQLVAEANARAEQAERQFQRERSRQESAVAQYQKQHERELQMKAEKLAESMALLDEREDQVSKLKTMVQTLQSKLSEHAEGVQLAEDEVDELHHENEDLRQSVEKFEALCKDLQKKNTELHSDSNKLSELRLELKLLKEERDRERVKTQSEAAVAHGNRAQVEEERDSAIAQAQDLQQRLAAALADLEIVRTDMDRILLSRNNLQVALESFQSEREAELSMLEEQRLEREQGINAAHSTAIDAMREANAVHVREIQKAADASVRHSMEEIRDLEAKLESFRAENVQMRRALDEAIHRLQATQEDVIDRTLMKNVLLDWLTKTGTKERKDVLELMASVLHFSEDEKERVHIGPHAGTLEKVVHSVAAPLPPSKADVEHLAGDSVREKWVNFLLAETED